MRAWWWSAWLAACVPAALDDTTDPTHGETAVAETSDPPADLGCADDHTLVTADGEVSCAAAGQLCDPAVDACVDPWRYGAPTFAACGPDPDVTPASLATKAATYDARAAALHVHPDLGWMMGVTLPPGVDPATATWRDVAAWDAGENDGLWSALYLASQAFRYAATEGAARDEALAMVRRLVDAEAERMAVSGVPGNFVRTYRKPGVDGLACPADDAAYRADVEKDDNRWVRVREDGCLTWLPQGGGPDWVVSQVCPGPAYAGWCFLDNTSKDEYSGHLFALGAVLKLVDDPGVVATARGLVGEVVDTLLANELWMLDPDGRRTEHGDFSPLLGFGFNAAMSLGFLTLAEDALDDPRLTALKPCFTTDPLGDGCPAWLAPLDPFPSYLDRHGVYLDPAGCKSNDNVASMHLLSLVDLIWWERDPELRAVYQASLEQIWTSDNGRALSTRDNAWYDLIWAAFKPHGAGRAPAADAVTEAACGLAVFPEDEVRREVPPSDQPQLCLDRLDRPMGATPRGPHERCLEAFVWWKDQYVLRGCAAEPTRVEPPADYLLPYWMGRYFGFVDLTW